MSVVVIGVFDGVHKGHQDVLNRAKAIAGDEKIITDWLGADTAKAIGTDVEVIWVSAAENDGDNGIVAVHLSTPSGVVRLD